MKLVIFKKHSCIEKKYQSLAQENFNRQLAINPENIVSVLPRSKTKLYDTSESVSSSDVWCELYSVSGGCWDVDGTFEEVINKLSSTE